MKLRWLPRLVVLSCVALCALLFAAIRGSGDDYASYYQRRDDRISKVRFNSTPLKAAFEQLATDGGVTINVDWGAIRNLGILPNTPVTLTANNIRFSKAVHSLLDQLSPSVYCDYIVGRDGSITVTTPSEFKKFVVTLKYDIRHFLLNTAEFENGKTPPLSQTRLELVDSIVKLLMDTVASETWKANGGDFGEITYQDGFLHIVQTRENHRGLRKLFDQLYETRASPWMFLDLLRRPAPWN